MPTISCQKLWTIDVGVHATLSAYWTLNEASGNRVDSVQGIQWIPQAPVGGPFTSLLSDGAALFINGLRLTGSGGSGDGRIFTNDEPGLATTGTGMSIAGWFRVNGTPAGGDVLPQLILSADTMLTSGNISLQLCSGYTNNNGIVGGSDVNSNSASLPFAFTTGIWNFFCIVYDSFAQVIRFQLNGGVQTSFGSGMQYPASTTGSLRLFCASIFSSGMDVQYDEIAISVNGAFSSSQIAYLYNGGAGRSWPIVLP